VPYNPYNFSDQKYGEAKVAAAGPAANLAIALVFVALIQLSGQLGLPPEFIKLSLSIIVLNIFLALFNLLPIPPLDGSKILPILLPFNLKMKYQGLRLALEQNVMLAFVVIFGLVFFVLGKPLYYATVTLAQLLTGL